MSRSLSEFVDLLERHGELVRVRARVSPLLEIAAIADRLSKCPAPHAPSPSARATDPRFHHLGGPAVLFENVDGSDIPVLINALGSYRRMELALGRTFQEVADRIASLVKPQPPRSLGEALAKAREFLPLLGIAPKRRRASDRSVVLLGDAVDLTRLPIIRCWPLDGDLEAVGWPADINRGIEGVSHGPEWDAAHRGRYITLAGIHTIHADDRDARRPPSHNIGMYRVQLLGPRRLAMHWHMHHDGASHWRSWKRLGKPMPVAIVLGGEAVLPYAATAPLPPGISELLMAGFLNGGGIDLARAKTVPLWVPAHAEIVIEGYASHEAGPIGFGVDRGASGAAPSPGPGAVVEGPFGDHTGFYSLPDRYPIVTVTAVTMRPKPIYPTTVVGLPPQEDYFLGKATERIMLPLLKTLIHDIEDYDLPMFGAFHNCAVVKIRKAYPLHARRVMHAIWGAGQMSWTKCIFVVDHDVDVHDTVAVLRAAARFCKPGRDFERVRGPLDILDHAAPYLGAGTKVGFDCTPKREGEQASDPLGPLDSQGQVDLGVAAAFARQASSLPGVLGAHMFHDAPDWLFLRTDIEPGQSDGPGRGRRVLSLLQQMIAPAEGPRPRRPAFVIAVGPDADLDRPSGLDAALFHWCANFDPGRDMFVASYTCDGDPPDSSRAVALMDATPKAPRAGRLGDAFQGLGINMPVRDWPPLLAYDQATQDLVSGRWHEYGLSAFVPAV